jgi:hypothetical protein
MSQTAGIERLGRASQRSAIVSLLAFLLIGFSLLYSSRQLMRLQDALDKTRGDLTHARRELERLKTETKILDSKVKQLKGTQASILDFLGSVASGEQVKLVDVDHADWQRTENELISLPAGQRKKAVFGAVLLAWKDIPFKVGGRALGTGLDSTSFMRLVLTKVGVQVPDVPGLRPSAVMMKRFVRVTVPKPGDLMFYRGDTGNFVVMYLARGAGRSRGICLGTLETANPLGIIDSVEINEPDYAFLGYYAVPYRD